ncbi:hypothetical protein L9F63_025790, partial [Diploptera punctata]
EIEKTCLFAHIAFPYNYKLSVGSVEKLFQISHLRRRRNEIVTGGFRFMRYNGCGLLSS